MKDVRIPILFTIAAIVFSGVSLMSWSFKNSEDKAATAEQTQLAEQTTEQESDEQTEYAERVRTETNFIVVPR